jgi:hypothetical protein
MANTRVIELVNKQPDGNGNVNLIAECNDYNELGFRVQQLSRSPFTFSETLSDNEIIDILRTTTYSIYF